VGSDDNAARNVIGYAMRLPRAQIDVSRSPTTAEPGRVSLTVTVSHLPPVAASDVAELVLAVAEGGIRVDVKRGENGGKTLAHEAVVRELRVLAEVHNAGTFDAVVAVPTGSAPGRVSAVAFVQERQSRRVLGTGALERL
jgi:hypothetical protein